MKYALRLAIVDISVQHLLELFQRQVSFILLDGKIQYIAFCMVVLFFKINGAPSEMQPLCSIVVVVYFWFVLLFFFITKLTL